MRRFAQLYEALDMTTSTNEKVAHLVRYFEEAPAGDSAWVIYLFSGRRLRRPVKTRLLREWTYEEGEIKEWLFDECYQRVGDLAETIALVLDRKVRSGERDGLEVGLSAWVERLKALRGKKEEVQREALLAYWRSLDRQGIFLLNKLAMGAMRVGVSKGLITRALAEFSGLKKATVAHRLMGDWTPSGEFFEALIDPDNSDALASRPYPFFLANPLEESPEKALGKREDWFAEWKWDGIRGQLIRRGSEVFLWSRGQELITKSYPEIAAVAQELPEGTVLDGEIMAWDETGPLPFGELQRRIGRKRVPAKLQREVPVQFIAYDLLEWEGRDLREKSFQSRREKLEALLDGGLFALSQEVVAPTWEALLEERETSRERKVEGLMLKGRQSTYGTGRQKGDWWKWKVDPYTLDAILLYGQAGHGRRAGLHTDYTFGIWKGEDLVPIAKAYSGLSNEEIRELDQWIKKNTVERFGPVRSVKAHHVFELAFAGLQRSSRHKSGVALRFPRILRWRRDKSIDGANTLEDVEALLKAYEGEHYEVPET